MTGRERVAQIIRGAICKAVQAQERGHASDTTDGQLWVHGAVDLGAIVDALVAAAPPLRGPYRYIPYLDDIQFPSPRPAVGPFGEVAETAPPPPPAARPVAPIVSGLPLSQMRYEVVLPLSSPICLRMRRLAMDNELKGRPPTGFLIGPKQAEELRDAVGASMFVDTFVGLPVRTDIGIDGIALVHGHPYQPGGSFIADRPFQP